MCRSVEVMKRLDGHSNSRRVMVLLERSRLGSCMSLSLRLTPRPSRCSVLCLTSAMTDSITDTTASWLSQSSITGSSQSESRASWSKSTSWSFWSVCWYGISRGKLECEVNMGKCQREREVEKERVSKERTERDEERGARRKRKESGDGKKGET